MVDRTAVLRYYSSLAPEVPELSFLNNRESTEAFAERMYINSSTAKLVADELYQTLPPFIRHIANRKARKMIRSVERNGHLSFTP